MASTGHDDGIGKFRIIKPSFLRRLMMEGLDAIPPGHTMMALLELDVTKARKALRGLRANGRKASLFAFVIKAINKELNSIRGAKGMVEFEDIDVNVPMEFDNSGEKFPHQLIIRKAQEKSVERICRDVNEAREQFTAAGHAGREDKWALSLMRKLFLVPKFLRADLKPVIVGGESQAREMLSMTVVFNHDIVDGAPAARFVNRLRKIVEGVQPVASG